MLDGGVLKTPIGTKIEAATRKELPATDWSLNLEICDMINSAQDGPQQAVKAIRARLQQRDGVIVDNVLTLLDTLVKNCGRRFHLLIATRDFMCDLIRLVSPRDPTPQHVKDKALTLIERCSDAFKSDKDLSAVGEAYQYLKSQSVQFPPQNLDDMVAIHTPRASQSGPEPAQMAQMAPVPTSTDAPPNYIMVTHTVPAQPTGYTPQPAPPAAAAYIPQAAPPAPYIPQQPAAQQGNPGNPGYHTSGIRHDDLQRLNKELLVVRGNDSVMNDILADLTSNPNPSADELQLLRDLHRTCKEMHTRMVELLSQVEEEGLVCQLLDLIDKLNNSFIRYDRYERNVTMAAPAAVTGGPAPLPQPATQPATQPQPAPAAQQQDQEPAGNIYAAPEPQRRSDIEELLSLSVPTPTTQSTNPFQEFVNAPVSRLPPVSGQEDDENIYTTAPAKIPAKPTETEFASVYEYHDRNIRSAPLNPFQEDIHVSLESNMANLSASGNNANDEFDMFAQSRSSTLSDRAQASGSEVAYEAAHDVPQEGSLAGAVHSRSPVDPTDDHWLHELNTVESTSQAMSNEEFDRFLNERAPAPPTTALTTSNKQSRKQDDDLLAL
ncbi:target of Myb1 membrane trafficking protein-like isoform X2 [Bolinopsis microptera]|uniref:target of Myb1 membrane trafficking protein-like isoform X2 n=1 Tax=Bolinopsis microptera TaxID=2820187 RepID=UPI003078DDBF